MGYSDECTITPTVSMLMFLSWRLSQFLKTYIHSQPESILPELINALNDNRIPAQSPIAIQAIIGGIISQTLVSVVTGQSVLKDSIEFDATTLNVTEFCYYLV